jgi:hypothetical protein
MLSRLEKCKLLKEKGYTYNPETGKIYGVRGNEIIRILNGYIYICPLKKSFNLRGHHFAWYIAYGESDYEQLDHINGDRSDNRISNLRKVTNQQNCFNKKNIKGYYYNGSSYVSRIKLNGKTIHLGSFDTEEAARQAYLTAKSKYHTIN